MQHVKHNIYGNKQIKTQNLNTKDKLKGNSIFKMSRVFYHVIVIIGIQFPNIGSKGAEYFYR